MEELLINQQNNRLNEILRAVKELSSSEMDLLQIQFKRMRVKNYPIIKSKSESQLLEEINKGLSYMQEERYNSLLSKRIDELLSEIEYKELLELTTKKEAYQEERLKNMISLAKLKGITLSKLAEQLELKAELYVA